MQSRLIIAVPGEGQVLTDELLTKRPLVDQENIFGLLNLRNAQAQTPAQQPDIQEQHLEMPIVALGGKGQTVGGRMAHLVGHPRQTEQPQRFGQVPRSLFAIDLALMSARSRQGQQAIPDCRRVPRCQLLRQLAHVGLQDRGGVGSRCRWRRLGRGSAQ
jgi:hypothetical protein